MISYHKTNEISMPERSKKKSEQQQSLGTPDKENRTKAKFI